VVVERVLGWAEIVDLEIVTVLVEVLLLLNVKYWSSQILKLSCGLRHLKFFRDLHDLLKFGK